MLIPELVQDTSGSNMPGGPKEEEGKPKQLNFA